MFQNTRARFFLGIVILPALLVPLDATGGEGGSAAEILKTTRFQGGLIVHLGCGDGKLTGELAAPENCIVQGLDADADNVREAREHLASLGIYGRVSADRFDGVRLPYADNLANLIVAETLGNVSVEEAMRALAPGGVLCVKESGRWQTAAKPRPADIGEWTHYLHDASGNPVTPDEIVGPPGRMQWMAGPLHMRSHEHIPGIYSVVSSGGRIFYILDEATTGALRATPDWKLVARDAFNGTLLWKKPIDRWFPHIVNWGQTPRQLQRKLVAVGDRVYVTLGLHAPLAAVDAATGELVRSYEGTEGAEELILHEGILLVLVRSVTRERIEELDKWARLVGLEKSPLDNRDTAEPLVKRLRSTESQGEMSLLAIDAQSGRRLWNKGNDELRGLRSLTLSAEGPRVFYQQGENVVCLDLRSGRQRWSAATVPLGVVHGGRVYCASGTTAAALSAETGEILWTRPTLLTEVRDVFLAGGSLWLGGFNPFPEKRGPSWGPYFVTQCDPGTGEVLMHVEPDNPGHHHRCYSNKATNRYILGGRRGTEFIDLASGEVLWNSWARGVCKFGVMPANGLLYTPPHACGCYTTVKLMGFHALAPRAAGDAVPAAKRHEPERGPAFDASRSVPAAESDAWPTYRRDPQRSGTTESPVPAELRLAWQIPLGGRLTAPTAAGGKVFVARVDEHRLVAVDARSGKPAWQFVAGARIDSPPTIDGSRAIFGCRDGSVYALRAADGELAWRLQAARHDRRAAVDGQIESVLPVHGSVLVDGGVVFATAGRSSFLDGGIDLCRIDPERGELLSRTAIYSLDPETGRGPEEYGPNGMPGSRSDILSSDEEHVYLRDAVYDKQGAVRESGHPHLFTVTDFLDDAWSHRSYWIFGTESSIATGCSGRDRNLIYGRLLLLDEGTIYGYGRSTVHWSNQLEDGPYRMFAMPRGGGEANWTRSLPLQVRAMIRAAGVIFAAGAPVEESERSGTFGEAEAGHLLAVSAADGKVLAEYPLDSPPVFDGMAAAGGRLFIALENGRLACMAPRASD